MVENIKVQIEEVEKEIRTLRAKRENLADALKEEFLKMGLVEGLAEYIKFEDMFYGQIFGSCGSDSGEWFDFGDIRIHSVSDYGYIDVLGLTDEQLAELKSILGAR